MLARILFLVASLLLSRALHAEGTTADKVGFASRLTIYLAKGPPDACGPGCDRWIAIEGQIDQDAAPRVRRFLAGVKDTQRPIYLHSPGGSVEQSYVIGRLLRGRKAIARVGRTVATGCAAGTPMDAACLKIKNAGGEIEAELTTYHAMCNSACGYVFLGATSREVAPDAALAVHNSRLVLAFHGHPAPGAVAEYRQRRMATADRDRTTYITAMGISRELDDLIRTVKFENLHVLTRAELYRFGIDTRPLAETAWKLEQEARPFLRKVAMLKKENGSSFRTTEWRLSCESGKRVPLTFAGEIDETSVGKSTILVTADADTDKAAGGSPLRAGKYEVWRGSIDPDMIKALLASRSSACPRNHADAGRQGGHHEIRHRFDGPDVSVDAARGVVFVGGIGSEEPLAGSFAAERQCDAVSRAVAAKGFKITWRLEPVRRSLRPQVRAADPLPRISQVSLKFRRHVGSRRPEYCLRQCSHHRPLQSRPRENGA